MASSFLFVGALAAAPDTPGQQQKELKRGADAPFSIPRWEPGRGAVFLLTCRPCGSDYTSGQKFLFFSLKVLGSRVFLQEAPAGVRGRAPLCSLSGRSRPPPTPPANHL